MSDDDCDPEPLPPPSEALAKAVDRPGANTGVKGVKADYEHAKREMEALQRVQNEVAWINVAELGMVAATVREQEEMQRKEREARDRQGSSDEEDDDGDDSFMAQYRATRLEQLKVEQAQAIRACYRPTFGDLLTLTAEQLSESVDAVRGMTRRLFLRCSNPFLSLGTSRYVCDCAFDGGAFERMRNAECNLFKLGAPTSLQQICQSRCQRRGRFVIG